MGMWSVPWSSVEKAKIFAERMQKPWMADVIEDEGDFFVEHEEIGGMFWETDCLIGSDGLMDFLAEEANAKQTSFDIREAVKKSLEGPMREIEMQPYLPPNLEAVNIVRVALGFSEISAERELMDFQKIALTIKDKIKSQITGPSRYSLHLYPPEISGMARDILGIPKGFEDQNVYCLVFETKEEKEFPIDLADISNVKRFNCERPGLFRAYYVL